MITDSLSRVVLPCLQPPGRRSMAAAMTHTIRYSLVFSCVLIEIAAKERVVAQEKDRRNL